MFQQGRSRRDDGLRACLRREPKTICELNPMILMIGMGVPLIPVMEMQARSLQTTETPDFCL